MSSSSTSAGNTGAKTSASAAASAASMAEKLRLWKATKQSQPVSAHVKKSAPTTSTAVSNANAEKVNQKRSFNAVTNSSKDKVAKVNVSKKSKVSSILASAPLVLHTTTGIAAAAAAAPTTEPDATMQIDDKEVEDENEDLGISFSATGLTPPPAVAPLTSANVSTPVSCDLRQRLMEDTISSPQATNPTVSNTPRAQQLREALKFTPPSAVTPASALKDRTNTIMTPVAAALAKALREEPPTTIERTNQTHTPHAERLRETLLMKVSPLASRPSAVVASTSTPAAAVSKLTCTPVAQSLASLIMEKTPPQEKNSMVQLQRESERIASRALAMTAPKSAESVDTSADMSNIDEGSLQLNTPPTVSIMSSRENTPVARNLMSEIDNMNSSMDSSLNMSCAPLDEASEHAITVASAPAPVIITDAELEMKHAEEEHEAVDLSGASSVGLFQEDEFIPGLSTPAAFSLPIASSIMKNLATGASAQKSMPQIFSADEASPAPAASYSSFSSSSYSTVSALPTSASKRNRMLTPSKAQAAATDSSSSGSSVVLASVKAHPRDAARLGSDIFLSPVRRSVRARQQRSAEKNQNQQQEERVEVEMEDLDQQALAGLLKDNNYAYHPNPALQAQLAPIPVQRAPKVDSSSSSTSSSSSVALRSTPMPPRSLSALAASSGSSVVVLQPVRSTGGRRSNHAAAAAAVSTPDPKSAEYLLSPVRRSARHTQPQSITELTKLLAHTKYAYKANPLLSEDPLVAMVPQSPAAASTSSSSSVSTPCPASASSSRSQHNKGLTSIVEEEDDDEQEMDQDEEDSHMHDLAEFTSPSLLTRVSSRMATRNGTPMPLAKTQSKSAIHLSQPSMMSTPINKFDKSDLSVSSSSSMSMMIPPSPSPAFEKDSEGFFIPLPPKRGSKRRAAPVNSELVDELGAKLASVAVSMMQQKLAHSSSSSSSSSAPVQTRMATPRPSFKKQKRMAEDSIVLGHTPVPMRRSTRVATPIH